MAKNVYNLHIWRKAQKVEAQSNRDYSDVYNQIELELRQFYRRSSSYRLENLNSVELQRFKNYIIKVRDIANNINNVELKERVTRLLRRVKISREERLLLNIESKVAELTEIIIEDTDALLTKSIDDNFLSTVMLVKSTAERIKKVSDIVLSKEIAKQIKEHTFPGAKFDDFIKQRHKNLFTTIERTVIKSLRTGTGIKAVSKDIRKMVKRQKGFNKLAIRNQMSHVLNLSAQEAMKKLDVEYYRFNAIVDSRTTVKCLGLNNTVHRVADGIPGVNMPPTSPPVHPCRSFITPYYGENNG